MKLKVIYGRNLIFGAEDGFVSTVGFLSGIAAADVQKTTIFLTGIILILVEAFSMATGSFLSEQETEEYIERKAVSPKKSIAGAIVMFFSYFISGLIPLSPYLLLEVNQALPISVGMSLISLFFLGIISALFFKINVLKHALQMLIIGGVAIAIGVIVGRFLKNV